MLCILKKPDHLTDITTNSSSEIFVFDSNAAIDIIEELIDVNGWRWWFGEKKTLTEDTLEVFIESNNHVFEDLFPQLDIHDLPDFYDYHDKQNIIDPKFDWCRTDIIEYMDLDHGSGIMKKFDLQDKIKKNWVERHMEKFKALIGIYYYDCGEDNELKNYFEVHNTIPGRYARLS